MNGPNVPSGPNESGASRPSPTGPAPAPSPTGTANPVGPGAPPTAPMPAPPTGAGAAGMVSPQARVMVEQSVRRQVEAIRQGQHPGLDPHRMGGLNLGTIVENLPLLETIALHVIADLRAAGVLAFTA